MSYLLKEITDSSYDDVIEQVGAYFTQSSLYKNFQAGRNLTVKTFVITESDIDLAYFQIIIAPLLKNYRQIYLPHGPVLLTDQWSENLLQFLKQELTNIAKSHRAVFVRLDSPADIFSSFFIPAPSLAYHTALAQPRFEWVMDISNADNFKLDTLPKEVRYSIRTAEKRGVTTKVISHNLSDYLDDFYTLMTETADRNGFYLHPKNYYQSIFTELDKTGKGFLVIASFGDEILVVNLLVTFGQTALHLFGGSATAHKDKLASYLAHFAGFKEAHQRGLKYYSFGGIAYGDNPELTWKDLTAFKQKFPGQVHDFGPIYDIIISPVWYYIYNFYKYLRQK